MIEALLLLLSLSVSLTLTVAEFTIGPGAVGVTTMVAIADAFAARLPIAQVTGPVPLHEPTVAEAETKVTLAGRLSVTLTFGRDGRSVVRDRDAIAQVYTHLSGIGRNSFRDDQINARRANHLQHHLTRMHQAPG